MADKLETSICSPESTSTKEETNRTLPEEAFNHFLQGKRHMLVQDYSHAVTSLTEACDQYVKHFGELAIECGEVYFLYGKALFRYSQEQSGVLGDVLNEGSSKDDENSSDGEKENDSDKNDSGDNEEDEADGEKEEGEQAEPEEEEEEEEKDPSESTDSPRAVDDVGGEGITSTEADQASAETPSADQTNTCNADGGNADGGNADSVPGTSKVPEESDTTEQEDDLELAWNALETAKSIFTRQGKDNKEAQLKVADILLLLAEISMESDNNYQAIQDLKECLEIQQKYLGSDDRILAETYYQMGLAFVLDKQYFAGVANFKTTKDIIELKVKNLKLLPVKENCSFEDDPKFEISNLESILPDIKEKIEDTEELIRNAKKELEEAFAMAGEVSSSSAATSSSNGVTAKPIQNINHLLKRKKPDPDNEKEIESQKRLKLSACSSNGDVNMLPDTTSEANV